MTKTIHKYIGHLLTIVKLLLKLLIYIERKKITFLQLSHVKTTVRVSVHLSNLKLIDSCMSYFKHILNNKIISITLNAHLIKLEIFHVKKCH